ncbi:MAG TPA: DUF433 domain-containing protein [Gammaproteobacteria bacterium]|nr:DUF433 domain-containing protein [Gammaproteobacteria bacterium]
MSKRAHSSDPRELPAYVVSEAAHYLTIPKSTLRYWAAGRAGESKPLIDAAQRHPLVLSFRNLVELHVLSAMRKEFEVTLPKVRSALDYLKRKFRVSHPLIAYEFETDGVNLFVERYGQLINASQEGQAVMREVLQSSLTRIERDPTGIPIKLYPYTRNDWRASPALVVIDPALSFGRPVIAGTGLATEVIADRYKAGESIRELAQDYGRSAEEVEEAIRCELEAA